jgi:NAD(P)H dehydrogenase (quinone)
MKAHLVIAHPQESSFNFALHSTAIKTLTEKNVQLNISNLNQQKFNAIASLNDATDLPESQQGNIAKAQRWAVKNNSFTDDIKQEQQKLLNTDLLILQFPLWWWSYPAQLKGWIDRVFSAGFAYGEGAVLPAKKVMYSITTGGASNDEERAYYQNKIDGLYQDIFGFIGWQTLPAFIAHGVQQKTAHERTLILENYQQHLLENIC